MLVVPGPETPVTTPLVEFTVANEVLLLLQVPPVVASPKAVDKPTQTEATPVIAVGEVFTVTWIVVRQLPTVYVMLGVPAVTPVTTPPATVASAVLLLLHAPPLVASLSAVVKPVHTIAVPAIAAG